MNRSEEVAIRQFAALMGLPDDPIALAFGRKLQQLNRRSDTERRRIKNQLWAVLGDMEVLPQAIPA